MFFFIILAPESRFNPFQPAYLWTDYDTVFNLFHCYMLCIYCCLDQKISKKETIQHFSQTERGGS